MFATTGQFLRTAGPGGLLLAIGIVGVTAIGVMEGLGEMIVRWPVANAMVQYVAVLVDRELSLVVGIVYWYTWASIMPTMLIAAANFTADWGEPTIGTKLAFYLAAPIVIIIINCSPIPVFGWIEFFAGLIKFLFVIASALFLVIVGWSGWATYINDGFQVDPGVTASPGIAAILIIPFLSYGFLGIELISVTAYESREQGQQLRHSARWIAIVITVLFFLSGIGECLNIRWNDPGLPPLDTRQDQNSRLQSESPSDAFSILVLAAKKSGHGRVASTVNALLIFSCLSAANTASYVSSRMLFGLCRSDNISNQTTARQLIAKLARLHPKTRVPMRAVIFSWVAAGLLPVLQANGTSATELLPILITIGSVGGVIVWACQCLAYIRWWHWRQLHKREIDNLRRGNPATWDRYAPWAEENNSYYWSILGHIQPLPAYIGFIGCFMIVFVFSTATMWNHNFTVKKFFIAYAGPLVCLILWISLKFYAFLYNREEFQFWVELRHSLAVFVETVDHFEDEVYERDYQLQIPHGVPVHIPANDLENGLQSNLPQLDSENDSIIRGAGSVLAEHRVERERRDVSLIGILDDDTAPGPSRRHHRELEKEDLPPD